MARGCEAVSTASQAVLAVKHGVARGRERFGAVVHVEHDHIPAPVRAKMIGNVALDQARAGRAGRQETRAYVAVEPAQHGAGALRHGNTRFGTPLAQCLQKARQRVSKAEATYEDLRTRRTRKQAGETTELILRGVILAVHQLPAVGAYHVQAVPLVEIELVAVRRVGIDMGPHASSSRLRVVQCGPWAGYRSAAPLEHSQRLANLRDRLLR